VVARVEGNQSADLYNKCKHTKISRKWLLC